MRRVVPSGRQGDVQLRVVVEDGIRGDLLVALQVPVDGVAQFNGEMLVGLEPFVDDDGHLDLLDELPWRKHQGAGLAEVVLPRFAVPSTVSKSTVTSSSYVASKRTSNRKVLLKEFSNNVRSATN